jgi:hypothetical protein
MDLIAVALVAFIVVNLVVFLIVRQLMLWYFRIDEALDLLASIDESLKCLPAVREARAAAYRKSQQVA